MVVAIITYYNIQWLKRLSKILTSLEVQTFIWEKDSHGLFDYESNKTTKTIFNVKGSCRLIHNPTTSQIQFQGIDQQPSNTTSNHFYNILVSKYQDEKIFTMEPQFQPPLLTEQAKTTPFLVVRSLKNQDGSAKGHSLQIGDVIKLGRMEYLVLQYRDKRKTYSLGPSTLIDPEDIMEVSKSQRVQDRICRVCFCDQETQQNFLVSPCLCKGSCLFVHINCLRRWITSKIKRQIGVMSSMYNFSKLECQICKRAFPHALKRNNKSMPMVSIQKPNKPYIILQSLNESRVGQKVLFLNCVNQNNSTIRLGRSQTSQIRISDISVSRNHATIKFEKKKFKLYDSSSKFGTLVRIRESICFGFDLLALQIGRTVILFSMRNKGMSSCTDDQPEQP